MRKYFIIGFLILATMLTAIIGCGVKRENKLLAKIGDRTIALGEFEQRYRHKVYPSEEEEKEDKMKTLNTMIEEKLFAIAGEKDGMSEEVEKTLEDYPDRLAVNQLYEEMVVKKAKVSLIEVKKTYRKMGRELHGRHIVLKTKEEADSIYRELRKNDAKNFADLARLSIDTKTKDKAGDLGWFVWGRMDPEHQEIAYKLKLGQISKPFETRFGWDVLQIVDERTKKIRTFEEEKQIIESTLKRQKMTKTATDFLDKIKSRAKIHYDTTAIRMLAGKSPQGKPANPFEPPPLPVLTEEEGKQVIVTSILGTITAADLIADAEKKFRKPPLNTEETIIRFLEGELTNKLLVRAAGRLHLQKHPDVIKNYNRTLDNRVAGEYRKKYISPREEIPEDEMKSYYETNKETYSIPEKRMAKVIVIKLKPEADDIYRRVKRGGDIGKIAKEKSIHYTKNREGKLGPLGKKKFPEEFREKAFSMKKGELSKPFKTKDGYCVMKLIDIEPPGYNDFETVKNRIRSEMKNAERDKIKSDLVEKLKKDIPVTINEDVLLMAGNKEKEEERK